MISPDGSIERFADAETDTNSNTDNEKNDEALDNPAISLAEMSHAGATVLCLCCLCLLLPVILSWPNLAISLSDHRAAGCLVHA